MEKIIWLKPGQQISYCRYCGSHNLRINESGSYGSCNDCERNFIIRHRPIPVETTSSKGLTADAVMELRRRELKG